MGLYCVLTGAIEGFYPEVLLDLFKEKLYLPPTSIELGYDGSRHNKIIGKEGEVSPRLVIEKFYPSDFLTILVFRFCSGEHNGLVAFESGGFVYPVQIEPSESGISF